MNNKLKMCRQLIVCGLILCLWSGCATPVKTEGEPRQKDLVKEQRSFEKPVGFGVPGIDGGWMTVDGKRFFIVGVGYEPGCRPGMLPWQRPFQREQLSDDFRRIKEAGFNTIRVWGPLKDEELSLAEEFGLWVIQGIWFDPKADFNDPGFRSATYEMIEREVRRMSKHKNILYYLLMNEPHGEAVERVGIQNAETFYQGLIAHAKAADPNALLSYANCVYTDYMNWDAWDVVSHNVYPYSPVTINRSLGYSAYLAWLKKTYAAEKPLVITEFGLSVSPKGDGRGYGGNTLKEQRDGVVRMWDQIINEGCAGGCTFMWIDGWWKHDNEHVHDNHAEEWYGLLSADEDRNGVPRPVYYALKEYNRVIRLAPHDYSRVIADAVNVEVWVTDDSIKRVEMRKAPDGSWVSMTRTSYYEWEGKLDYAGVKDGMYSIETRGVSQDGGYVSQKSVKVVVASEKQYRREQVLVEFIELPDVLYHKENPYPVRIRVADGDGRALAGYNVCFGRFFHTWWEEFDAVAQTDDQGIATVYCSLPRGKGMMSVAAAVQNPKTYEMSGAYDHIMILPQP